MLSGMTTDELTKLTADYRRAKAKMDAARDALAEGVRQAYAGGERKADIIRAIDHEWTSTWLDRILKAES